MKKKLIILIALYVLNLFCSKNSKNTKNKNQSILKKLPYKAIFASLVGSLALYGLYQNNKLNKIKNFEEKGEGNKNISDIPELYNITTEDIDNNNSKMKKFIFGALLIGIPLLRRRPILNGYKNIKPNSSEKLNNSELNLNILETRKKEILNKLKKAHPDQNKSRNAIDDTRKLIEELKKIKDQIKLINKEKF